MKKIGLLLVCMTLGAMAFPPLTALAVSNQLILTKEKPLRVDQQAKSVTVLAEVKGKYFHQATRHGVVFAGGANGDKSVFRGYATPQEFYDALVKLGYKAGNNMTRENAAQTFVQGDALEVTVVWDGAKRAYGLDEVISDSNKKPFQIRFGGNLQNALQFKTGCLLCLDSCPVGITSNASYTMGAVEKRQEVVFKGNSQVLPPDGTLVVIKVQARK